MDGAAGCVSCLVVFVENRWPWLTCWFHNLTGPSIFPKPMAANSTSLPHGVGEEDCHLTHEDCVHIFTLMLSWRNAVLQFKMESHKPSFELSAIKRDIPMSALSVSEMLHSATLCACHILPTGSKKSPSKKLLYGYARSSPESSL